MIRFFNIRSGEELKAETEPQISALWFSSDKGPNANGGQDFGWRLAPEVVVQMDNYMSDPNKLQEIANRFRMMVEDIRETDILTYISLQTDAANAPVADMTDYTDAYNEKIKRLRVHAVTETERQAALAASSAPTTTTETTESLADMEKRVELEERLAAAKAKQREAEAVTTTTTTAVPITTSTTTKK